MGIQKLQLSAIVLFCLIIAELQAQNTIYIKEKAGEQNTYVLNGIRKLTFSSGNLLVNKTDGNINSFTLSTIRHIFFSDLSTNFSFINNQMNDKITLYPNPVFDQFQINCESSNTEIIKIEIIDVNGRVVNQQLIKSQNGKNYAIINTAQLTNGKYICRINIGNKHKSINFIKN